MDAIKELEARLNDMMKSREAFAKHVDRVALKEYISTLVSECRSVAEALNEITGTTMASAIKKLMTEQKSSPAIRAYDEFTKALAKSPNKTASTKEASVPFSSLAEAAKARLLVLTKLELSIDDLFTHNTINLFNGRLSHIVVIGLLAESKMISQFSKYMLSAVVSVITDQRDIPKYRYVWMKDYTDATAEAVSKSLNNNNGYNLDAIIKDLQNKAVDVTLISDFNKVTLDMVASSKVSGDAKSLIKQGAKKLGLFLWIGQFFVNRKQEKIEEQRRETEWMRAHVALLKMKLENMSEDDAEFQRLVKIIARYEEMITKADKQTQQEQQA